MTQDAGQVKGSKRENLQESESCSSRFTAQIVSKEADPRTVPSSYQISYHGGFYLGHTGAGKGNSVLSKGVFSGGQGEEERVGRVGFLRGTGPRRQTFVILVFPIQHFDLSGTKKREFSTGKKNHTNITTTPGVPRVVGLVGQGYILTSSRCSYL